MLTGEQRIRMTEISVQSLEVDIQIYDKLIIDKVSRPASGKKVIFSTNGSENIVYS
jgi:hypothetical protein